MKREAQRNEKAERGKKKKIIHFSPSSESQLRCCQIIFRSVFYFITYHASA